MSTIPNITVSETPASIGERMFVGTAVAYWRSLESHGFAYPSGHGKNMTPARTAADALKHLATADAKNPGVRCAVAIYGRTFPRHPHTALRGNVASLAADRTFVILAGTMPTQLAAVIAQAGGRIVGDESPTPRPTREKSTQGRERGNVKVDAVTAADDDDTTLSAAEHAAMVDAFDSAGDPISAADAAEMVEWLTASVAHHNGADDSQ